MPSEANARTIRPDGHVEALASTRERGSSSGIEWANEIVLLVEHGGAAAGQPLDGLEAAGAGGGHRLGVALAATTSRLPKATIGPGRAIRSVSGRSPAATRSISARETAVSSAGSSGNDRVM